MTSSEISTLYVLNASEDTGLRAVIAKIDAESNVQQKLALVQEMEDVFHLGHRGRELKYETEEKMNDRLGLS